jgi:hypothetical protein
LQSKERWGIALQDFMSNEVLIAEFEQQNPSIPEEAVQIEITSTIIHKLLDLIQDIGIE